MTVNALTIVAIVLFVYFLTLFLSTIWSTRGEQASREELLKKLAASLSFDQRGADLPPVAVDRKVSEDGGIIAKRVHNGRLWCFYSVYNLQKPLYDLTVLFVCDNCISLSLYLWPKKRTMLFDKSQQRGSLAGEELREITEEDNLFGYLPAGGGYAGYYALSPMANAEVIRDLMAIASPFLEKCRSEHNVEPALEIRDGEVWVRIPKEKNAKNIVECASKAIEMIRLCAGEIVIADTEESAEADRQIRSGQIR